LKTYIPVLFILAIRSHTFSILLKYDIIKKILLFIFGDCTVFTKFVIAVAAHQFLFCLLK
jgi:hypothetical protein